MGQKIRRMLINLIELTTILYKYRKNYIHYYLHKRNSLYGYLRTVGLRHIKIAQPQEWKIYYGSFYFRAFLGNTPVFIKVTGSATTDGFTNELALDKYINNHSAYLSERTPKVLLNFVQEDYHIIVFEYFNIQKDISQEELNRTFDEYVREYNKVGIIHQDIKPSNVTFHNGKYCIIDYGYAICPDSNHIRITKENYIDSISDTAKSILPDADFYYDDVIASGIEIIDRNSVNFIVGREEKYFIKLAGCVGEYRLERLAGRPVALLHKCSSLTDAGPK